MIELDEQKEDLKDLDAKALAIVEQTTAIVVKDQATHDRAVAQGRIIVTAIDDRKKFFAPMKEAAWKAHKAVVKQENDAIAPLEAARKDLSAKVGRWRWEEERKAAEARAKAEEEQRKRDEERRRKEAEAEAERQRKLKEAEAAEAAGKKKEADRLIEEAAASEAADPEPIPEPIKPTIFAPAKAKGESTRMIYSARVVDEVALIKAVAAGEAPKKAVTVDQAFLNKYATAMKEDFDVPGVELVIESKSSFRKI